MVEPVKGPQWVFGDRLEVIDVRDQIIAAVHAAAVPPALPRSPSPSDRALAGRGLLLTAAMATCWGYHPRRPHPGKFVSAGVPAQRSATISEALDGRRQSSPLLLGQALTSLREL